MRNTKIEWCDMTWNPVTGCLHGCDFCYAQKIATRFGYHWDERKLRHAGPDGTIHDLEERMYRHTTGKNRSVPVHSVPAPYPYGFDPTFHRYLLDEPQKVKESQRVFVCSMADLFGDWVPDEWIEAVFEACEKAPWHTYLFLTKNPNRLSGMLPDKLPPEHWYGQTITGGEAFGMPMENSFISFEPLLSEVYMSPFVRFGWVIIGAETGNRKGKVIPKKEWIDDIVAECRKRNVPVFMKDSLKELMGEDLVQEWPEGLK